MNDMVTFQIADAVVHLPRATILRNFLASLPTPPGEETIMTLAGIPPIGEYWPGQGGVNAGLMRGVNGTADYYLIVPTDEGAKFNDITWGSQGKEVTGASCEYDGMKNTLALINSGQEHPAAEKCRSLCIEGHRDFYLLARREAALCYANVPELFEKRWHWTSTQYSARSAWYQFFVGGYQTNHYKHYEGRVRAVRRFSPSSI